MKIFVNLITTFRFLYTLILPLLEQKISNRAFLINIIILFLTDSIDGFLARKFNVQTLYGSMMDTIADKGLSIILMILLVSRMKMLSIVLILEIFIAIISIYGVAIGKNIKSSLIGKFKMWLLSITIVFGYMNYFNIVKIGLVYISILITIIAQIFTILGYMRMLISKDNNLKKHQKINNAHDLKFILFDTNYYLSMNEIRKISLKYRVT